MADYQDSTECFLKAAEVSDATIVLLSSGSLQSMAQLSVIVHVMAHADVEHRDDHHGNHQRANGQDEWAIPGNLQELVQNSIVGPTVVPVYIDGFEFPDAHYYNDLFPKLWDGCCGCCDADEAKYRLMSFFRVIALPLSTSASNSVLDTQANAVECRIKKCRVSLRPSDRTAESKAGDGHVAEQRVQNRLSL